MKTSIRNVMLALALLLAGCNPSSPPVAGPGVETKDDGIEKRAVRGVIRVLYVVVEEDGVYFDKHRVDASHALAVLDELATDQKVTNVMVHVSHAARFGAAIQFYSEIDRARYHVFPLPTRSVPLGFRLPLVGIFRKRGCCWIDEENQQEVM